VYLALFDNLSEDSIVDIPFNLVPNKINYNWKDSLNYLHDTTGLPFIWPFENKICKFPFYLDSRFGEGYSGWHEKCIDIHFQLIGKKNSRTGQNNLIFIS
jgi:hypothetical protein